MSFLDETLVRLNVQAENAEDAIRQSGRLLVEEGYAEEGYIQAMVDSYRENGAYFVIAPSVAIPHARPETGALESAISFVQLTEGVAFGHEANDPVRLVFGLSAASSEEHVKVIQKIAKLLGKKGNIDKLLEADSYDVIHQLKEEIK
ncbi:PTS sugar transporter subunit IIA [Atopococcus tabaci]|uniref:PTS sugar transporter subunit IIA n=1 Tax=Atopococcus tabaci TaxID=269774 RepID=UPI0004112055|nr:PTS sugar transporter subunit IIA [Atopococcus tabaci]